MSTVDKLRDLSRALAPDTVWSRGTVERRQAIVISVSTGPARVNLKFVSSDPSTFPAAYLSSYTPTVSDTVWVDFVGPDPLVLGKQAL